MIFESCCKISSVGVAYDNELLVGAQILHQQILPALKITLTSFIENEIICARIVAIVRQNKVSQIRIGYAVINLVRPFCEIRTAFSFLKTFGITLTARSQIYSVEIKMLTSSPLYFSHIKSAIDLQFPTTLPLKLIIQIFIRFILLRFVKRIDVYGNVLDGRKLILYSAMHCLCYGVRFYQRQIRVAGNFGNDVNSVAE